MKIISAGLGFELMKAWLIKYYEKEEEEKTQLEGSRVNYIHSKKK